MPPRQPKPQLETGDTGAPQPEAPDNIVHLPQRRAPDERNLYQRLVDATLELRNIEKIKKGQLDYSYITVDALFALIRPVLARQGIVVLPHEDDWTLDKATTSQGKPTWRATYRMHLTFVNADAPKDRFEIARTGIADDVGDKALQKAETYAVKYGLLKLFQLGGDDDDETGRKSEHDDGQASAEHTEAPKRRTIPVRTQKCPKCKGDLEVVYNPGKKPFVGHVQYPNDCDFRFEWGPMNTMIKKEEALDAAAQPGQPNQPPQPAEAPAPPQAQQASTPAPEGERAPIDRVLDTLSEKAGEAITEAGGALNLVRRFNADRPFLLETIRAVLRSQAIPQAQREAIYTESKIEARWEAVENMQPMELAGFAGAMVAAYFTAKQPRPAGDAQ